MLKVATFVYYVYCICEEESRRTALTDGDFSSVMLGLVCFRFCLTYTGVSDEEVTRKLSLKGIRVIGGSLEIQVGLSYLYL